MSNITRKLTPNTPLEQLYQFYKKNPDLHGGIFSRDLLFENLTVEEFDKFWVFEKLLENDLLLTTTISLNNGIAFYVPTGVDKLLRWMIEKEKEKQ